MRGGVEAHSAQISTVEPNLHLMIESSETLQHNFQLRASRRPGIKIVEVEGLRCRPGRNGRSKNVVSVTVEQARQIDDAIFALDCISEFLRQGIGIESAARPVRLCVDTQAGMIAEDKIVSTRVGSRRIKANSVKLDRARWSKLPLIAREANRLLLAVHVEL